MGRLGSGAHVLVVVVAAAIAATSWCASALAAGDANRPSCGEFAGAEASPGFRTFLPDCRAYELVTPPYVGGQPVIDQVVAMSADGAHVLGLDFAGFAGTENLEQSSLTNGAVYEFSRTPSGWSTESLEPPASRYPRRQFVAASADLSRSLWKLISQPREGEELGVPGNTDYTYAIREASAGGPARFTVVGPIVSPEHEHVEGENSTFPEFRPTGESSDLNHIIFEVRSERRQLWPGDTTREGDYSLYEYGGTAKGEPALVGVKNVGPLEGTAHRNEHAELESECGTTLGSSTIAANNNVAPGSTYNAVSTGAVVYFAALHTEGCSGSQPAVTEVYARINGSHTVAVSEPAMTAERERECSGICREDQVEESKRSPGLFEGASEDGSKVFFTTEQPLLNSDKDVTRDLYAAEVGEAGVRKLVQVSEGDTTDAKRGSGANVVSVERISEDGSHVYYVAKGVLTTTPRGKEGELQEKAEEGGYNLYVYNTITARTSFVATLVTHQEEQELREEFTKEKPKEIEAEVKKRLEENEAKCKEEHPKESLKEKELRKKCDEKAKEEAKTEETAKLKELAEEVAKSVAEAIKEKAGVSARDENRPFQTTRDGRFLVFVNARHLTGSEDTSTVRQIFEYDAQAETLARVSTGQKSARFPAGYGDNGNTTNPEDAARILRTPHYNGEMKPTDAASTLSLSEKGSVVFSGGDALTPGAVGGRENVYEYRDGNVYLISPGDESIPLPRAAGIDLRLLGTDQSGGDVFFFTTNSLVPQDPDTQASWYDAREGGGFPAPALPAACAGDVCQGPFSATLPALGAGSTGPAEGNLAPPVSAPKAMTRAQRLSAALKACKKKPRKRRRICESQARKRYGRTAKAGKRNRGGRR